MTVVRTTFHTREHAADHPGQYRYDPIHIGAPGTLAPEQVPVIGDTIWLGAVCYQVLGRWWMYPTYGSLAWPVPDQTPRELICSLLVGPADGLFVDEAPLPDDEEAV